MIFALMLIIVILLFIVSMLVRTEEVAVVCILLGVIGMAWLTNEISAELLNFDVYDL